MNHFIVLYKYGMRTRNIWGRYQNIYFHFILVFYMLGAFLIIQLFHFAFVGCEIIMGYLPSRIQRALAGIIVKYTRPNGKSAS